MTRHTLLRNAVDWRWLGKSMLIAFVAGATVLKQAEVLPAVKIACDVVIGVGAAFGIASGGLSRAR